MSGEVESFTFDPRLLESLFSELAPPPEPVAPQVVVEADAYTMAADYLSMGLYDRAMAEASRAIARGGRGGGQCAAGRHPVPSGRVRRRAREVPRGACGESA